MDRNAHFSSEYAEDIIQWMKKRELHIFTYRRLSPQVSRRRHLVDWTSIVAEKLKLTSSTLHLAVKILDYFMDGHDIQDPQLYLVCLGSLLLAAKMEEKDSNVPKCSALNAFVKNHFPLSDFTALEFLILNYFSWNLCLPTACNFVELFMPYTLHPTDTLNNMSIGNFSETKAYFHHYVKYFLDVALQEGGLVDALPSLLASAIVAASRQTFALSPIWPSAMERISGYTLEKLQPFVDILTSTFHREAEEEASKEEEEASDEGYHSRTASPVTKTSHTEAVAAHVFVI